MKPITLEELLWYDLPLSYHVKQLNITGNCFQCNILNIVLKFKFGVLGVNNFLLLKEIKLLFCRDA